jgi:hypothetical protein
MAQRTARQGKNQRNSELQSAQSLQPSTDFVEYLKDYARQKPEMAALWCFGIGFVLGWKMKLW